MIVIVIAIIKGSDKSITKIKVFHPAVGINRNKTTSSTVVG